jgi:hypothetical protein
MRSHKAATLIPPILAAFAIVALTLYAYRGLPARPFAADDYQWLLNVQGLSFGTLLRHAFDPAAQTHFFRPLIWLLFWVQTRAFGLDPRGFHAVSLALHLLNAALLGMLAYRLQYANRKLQIAEGQFSIPVLVIAIMALHPAPFEAVVWISAQSELLAAALLLLALHLWLCRRMTNDEGRRTKEADAGPWSLGVGRGERGDRPAATDIAGTRVGRQETGDRRQETGNNRCRAIFNSQFSIFNSQLHALHPTHASNPRLHRAPDHNRAAQLPARTRRLWAWGAGGAKPAA